MPIENSARELHELFDRVSPSKASFQIDGGSATMDFIIDREKLGMMVSEILGSVYKASDGTGRLTRKLPAAHPYYDWLYATRINNIEGLQPYGRQLGEDYQKDKSLNYIYDFVTYKKYKVQVQFEPRPYLMVNDDDLKGKADTKKWYYNTKDEFVEFKDPKEYLRFVDLECEPNAEFLSSPQGQFFFKTKDNSAPGGANPTPVSNQNGGGINVLVVKRKIKMTWFFVPYEIVFSENVISGLGKVNQYDFYGFPAGSLLLEGTEVKRYPPPEQLLKQDPINAGPVAQKVCDITFVFNSFMQAKRDLSDKIPDSTKFKIAYGHNLVPRPGELKYHYVETNYPSSALLGNRPIYESYPMERLFRLE